MKTFIPLLIALFFAVAISAQNPQSFRYQAVSRDNSGTVLVNQKVSFQISILNVSVSGNVVYSETHASLSTNAFGLVELEIGKGTPVTGSFSAINWGGNTYFVKVEMDPTGGTAWQTLSTSQLLSVPYALHAKTVAELSDNSVTGTKIAPMDATAGQALKWSGTAWSPADDNGSLWQQSGYHIYYNNGSVGVGTSDPQRLLHLNTANVYSGILMTNDASGTTETDGMHIGLQYQGDEPANRYALILNRENSKLVIGTNNNNGGDLNILPGGNTGLGTSTPSTRLDVNGQIRLRGGSPGTGKILTSDAVGLASWQPVSIVADANNFTGDGSSATPLKLGQMGASTGQVLKWNGSVWDNAADDTGPWGETTTAIFNSTTKNFGLGISNPSQKLTVAEGGVNCAMNIVNYSTGYSNTDGLQLMMYGLTGWLANYENGGLNLATNSMARLTITSAGNVGVATTSPTRKLDVNGDMNIRGNSSLMLYCDGDEAIWYNGTYYSWGYGGTYNFFGDRIKIGGDGNVAPSTTYALYVTGSAYSTGSWSSSDLRFKKNISPISGALEKVLKVNGNSFEFRTKEFKDYLFADGKQFGFIAQELEDVFPELVNTETDGFKSVNYNGMIPVLLEAIKEQQKLIDGMKTENDQLKKQIENFNARLEQMEALTGYNADK